jgi:hypothetical protein
MFPTRLTLQVKRYAAGAENARGNAAVGYADPVDWSVHSVLPGAGVSATRAGRAGEEPLQPNRDLSLIDYTVLAPDDDNVPTERDLVVYGGDDYEVDGRPDRWGDANPWGGPLAPAVVRLRRSEG